MAQSQKTAYQSFINFPRQKLADSKKNDDWYKQNIDYAENLLTTDYDLRANFRNKKTNYNLRSNIINSKDFEKYINPDQLDLESLPASFQHVGIGNSKINLLLGEYDKRRKEYRAYLSSNDKDGISRKEDTLMAELNNELRSIVMESSISEEEIQERLRKFEDYGRYTFQDVAEITSNAILKREYKEQNLDFLFLRTFEDLLVAGEEIVYCGVLGGEPTMRRVNPLNLYTLGSNSMFIEDSDIIVEYGYRSIGQVIDDYYDQLKPKDIEFLETGHTDSTSSVIGLNRDISIFDRFGEDNALQIFHPNTQGLRTFAGAFDTYGNVRVLKVTWRSRRKIQKLKYYDDEGQEQYDYVDEHYVPNKDLGEEVEEQWVNEWLEGTKIADDLYTYMQPLQYAGKSLVNKSKGTPPYVGSLNTTNDTRVISLMDIMKPLDYSYDIAYYKRELEIATHKGSFAAINAAMVPSGWDPKEWIRYVSVNKFAFLDPTNEILKGPSQGKSAGAFNQLTATNVNITNMDSIQMYTNLLLDIEGTLGKVSGVSGAREGQIQNREAVGNVEREVAQTSHITEKWFSIDGNFRKRALTKFLEVCKFAYKKNPKRGQYLLDDMGMVMVNRFDEFLSSEYDIHIADSASDTKLVEDFRQLAQAAVQNGQAKIGDLISIHKSESIQEIGRKLEISAEKLKEEQQEAQAQAEQSQQQMQQQQLQAAEQARQYEAAEKEKDRQVKYAELEVKRELGYLNAQATEIRSVRDNDTDDNGIDDTLDLRRTDVDENHKRDQIRMKEEELAERKRANLVNEKLKERQISANKQKKSETK